MNIGILQGRLSPSPTGRFQFFPEDWTGEFSLAKEMGFSGIEWLIDKSATGINPILTHEDRVRIGRTTTRYGLPVVSVHGLSAARISSETLLSLVDAARHSTHRLLMVSLLEDKAPRDAGQDHQIAHELRYIVPVLEKLRVHLAFETEMSRDRLARFVDGFQSPWVGVLYDIGNCTSYGFDCPQDIRALAHRIKGVHVKDRKRGSTRSVMLGTGDADIRGCVRALTDIGWQGTLIMQAWRTPETYVQDARTQLAYLHDMVKEVEHGRS